MAEAAASSNPLTAASAVWRSAQAEIKAGEPKDGTLVSPDELKKVAKWLQNMATKFGATAAVSDSPTDEAVVAIADDMMKAFTASVEMMLCLSRGAGPSLQAELCAIGSGLATSLEEMGGAVGTPNLAVKAGQVLDRVKHLERMSTHNRAAMRRRTLKSLSQVRDAQRELQEALNASAAGAGVDDPEGEDDFLGSEVEFEPGERGLVEAIVSAIEVLLEVMKEVSQSCMPTSTSPSHGGGAGAADGAHAMSVLEEAALQSDKAALAVDGLAVHAVGGLDAKAFQASLQELREAAVGFKDWPSAGQRPLLAALDDVQAALDAVPPAD